MATWTNTAKNTSSYVNQAVASASSWINGVVSAASSWTNQTAH